MEKIPNRMIDAVIDILRVLRDNEYNLIWTLCDDILYNGHVIKIKSSTLWKHVIIDDGYVDLRKDLNLIDLEGNRWNDGLDYARYILEHERG